MEAPSARPVLARRVRHLRQQARLTQGQLAERIGCHQTQISSLERTGQRVSIDTVRAVARALGASLSYLYGEELPEREPDDDPAAEVRDDPRVPEGLRALAASRALCDELGITTDEWAQLQRIDLPTHASRDDCLELLLVLRRIRERSATR